MGIVQFPVDRLTGQAERSALRQGVAATSRPSLRLIDAGGPLYCAACAAPVEFGAVWRGQEAYCSVECSLGGRRPA